MTPFSIDSMEQAKNNSYLEALRADVSYLLGQWKEMFSPATAPKDVWAGITVALVALPLNLALAVAAGVEPGVGITTAIVAGVVAGLFGGQKFAVTGPAAAMAVVLIEIAHRYGLNAIWLVCILAGILQVLSGALRLGGLISFLPMPVIVGFANAIGCLVFFNAVDDFLGLPAKSVAHAGQMPAPAIQFVPDFIMDLMHIWTRCLVNHEANIMAIAIGSMAFALAYFTPKVTKAIPGQLVAILAATLVTVFCNFKIPVIKDIAAIPNMMPAPSVPDMPWNELVTLFPFVLTVFMLGSIESLLSASVADGMTGSSRHRPNQELIGQGLANIAVPFFGGIPVTGVIARTAVNIRSGAKTRLAAIVHSITLALLIFFLAKHAEQIPLSALAAILMLTGIRLVEWDAIREIWKGSKTETIVSVATTIAALCIDLTAGVFAGLFFACALFIRKMSDVRITPHDQEAELAQDLPTCKFVRTFVVDGPLFFGAAERFIESLVLVDNAKVVILLMKNARVMDLTGVETLLSIQSQLRRSGGRMVLAELPEQPLQLLERTGAIEKIGAENVFTHYRNAVVSINDQMLNSACKDLCENPKGSSHSPINIDCPLRNALLNETSPMSRLISSFRSKVPDISFGTEWLFPVESEVDIPIVLQGTPIETLLKGQNLGIIDTPIPNIGAQLLVGMCVDFRNSLCIPRDWAFIIRREGANMDGAEFAIALALSKGVRHMAHIAHSNCAMSNTAEHRDSFINTLSKDFAWDKNQAEELFEQHRRTREIGNEIDFAIDEAHRIEKLFPGLNVVPMLFRVEDDRLYLIYDWLIRHAPNEPIMRRLELRDTGQFKKPVLNREMPQLGS